MTSSGSTIRCASKSTRNILPGRNLDLYATLAAGISNTPVSDAITNRLSLVTVYLNGRRPLRSNTAPRVCPSVKVIIAGPSHGSISPP